MTLLLVEDEPRIQDIVREGLSEDGYDTEVASSAEMAMERITAGGEFDGFVLDILLPGLSGLELCRWLRDLGRKVPIVMLTAKGSLEDKVEGLDAGADDYLAKPFEIAELRARLRALFRKVKGYPREPLVVADLTLDPNTREVYRSGTRIALSKKETFLLEYLMKNSGRVVTRSMIAQAVWDTDTSQYTNVIDVFINHLRKKIDNVEPRLLHTVRGKGFRLTDSPEDFEGDA
jgi:DNA-binding response OmpR family regulator